MIVSTDASIALLARLKALVAQAEAGDQEFVPLAERAGQLAGSAGAKGSESWVVAQQALSTAVAARAPVSTAMGDIDALSAGLIQRLGGIPAADLKAIDAAAARVSEIDNREAATIARLQGQLSR